MSADEAHGVQRSGTPSPPLRKMEHVLAPVPRNSQHPRRLSLSHAHGSACGRTHNLKVRTPSTTTTLDLFLGLWASSTATSLNCIRTTILTGRPGQLGASCVSIRTRHTMIRIASSSSDCALSPPQVAVLHRIERRARSILRSQRRGLLTGRRG